MLHPNTGPGRLAAHAHGHAESGFSLIYMIVALTLLSALSAGVMALTTSSNYAEVSDRYSIQARYAAISGLNYIAGWNRNYGALEGKTLELTDDGGDVVAQVRFVDVVPGQDYIGFWGRAEILGIAAPGTMHESRYTLHASFQGSNPDAVSFLDPAAPGETGPVAQDFQFFEVISSDPDKEPVVKDEEHGRFTIGADEYNAFGSMAYTGNASMNFGENNCTDGECQFRYGLRAFMTTWYSKNDADGLVLTFFNGENNNWDSVGGHSTHGEMIGYAGDGRYQDGGWKFLDPEHNGIQPPKIGFEIDNWGNYHPRICNGDDSGENYPYYAMMRVGPNSGSRYDLGGNGGNGIDHLAVDLWGLDQPYMCAYREFGSTTAEGARTFDDNTHGFSTHMSDAMLAYTEDKHEGGMDYVRMYNGGVIRVGQAFTLSNVMGERDTDLNNNHYITAASFYVRAHGNPNGSIVARLYNSDGGVVGSAALPASEVNSNYTSKSVTTDFVFFDGDLHSNYQNTDAWRLITLYFNNQGDFAFSPNGNTYYATVDSAYPSARAVPPGDYVVVLEYDNGDSDDAVDIAVDKSSTWPGNYVQYSESTGTWSANSAWTPIYYVHLYEQLFPFADNVPYFDEASPTGGGYDDYRLFQQRNALRIEIDRAQTATAYGDEMRYKYNIRAWIRRCSDTSIDDECPDYVNTHFSNTMMDLNATKNPPTIDQDIYLTQAQHDAYDNVIIAFTEATGGSTQIATFGHFVVRFKTPYDGTINEVAYPGNH